MVEPNGKEGGEGAEQSFGLLDPSLPARTLLLHNAALLQNFEKCKYLEIDLETACVAGEAAHGQLLKVAYEKDMIILELEKATQQLQENIHILEEERKADYETWSKERQELINTVDEIERDKAKYSEMSQTLKSEIGDLHGMLDAMERATHDAEIRHANGVEFVKEENSLFKKDLDKARKNLKAAKDTILKTQKEITEMHAEATGLRAQLQDALNDARQYRQNSAGCMHANEQLRQSLMGAQENISELIKLRKEDEILYLQQLKDYQEGKGDVKEASVETGSVTLLERHCSKYGHHEDTREEFAVPTLYQSKRRPLHLDMTHLARRQMKLLDSLVAT